MRTAPLVEPAVGERVVTTELRLVDVLAELAAERARVLLVDRRRPRRRWPASCARSATTSSRSAPTADPPATAYVPAAAIAEVALG